MQSYESIEDSKSIDEVKEMRSRAGNNITALSVLFAVGQIKFVQELIKKKQKKKRHQG